MFRRDLLFFSGSNKTPVTPVYNKGMFFLDVKSGDFSVNDTATPDTPDSRWVIFTADAVDDSCGLYGTNFIFTEMDSDCVNKKYPRISIEGLGELVKDVNPSTISINADSLYIEQVNIEGHEFLYVPGLVTNPSSLHDDSGANFTWASNIYINDAEAAFVPIDTKGIEMTGIDQNKKLTIYKVGNESVFKNYDTSLTISYSASNTKYYRTIPLACTDSDYQTETTCGICVYNDNVELYVDDDVYVLFDEMHSKSSGIFIRQFEGKLWVEDNDGSGGTYDIDLDPELVYLPNGQVIGDVGWAGPSLVVSDMQSFDCVANNDPGISFGDVFYIAKNLNETHLLLPINTPISNIESYFYVILGDEDGNLAMVSPDIDGAAVSILDNNDGNPYALTTNYHYIIDILVSTNSDESAMIDNLTGDKMYANIFISDNPVGSVDIYGGITGGSILKVERIEECRFTDANLGGYNVRIPAIHRFYGLPTMRTSTIFKNM